eukprot:scaffold37177_cov70-Phaeocystis_antarctica.AAC.2
MIGRWAGAGACCCGRAPHDRDRSRWASPTCAATCEATIVATSRGYPRWEPRREVWQPERREAVERKWASAQALADRWMTSSPRPSCTTICDF